MTPLYVFAFRPVRLTQAVIVPPLVPEAGGGTLSHAPLVTIADQFRAPNPVLLTVTVWHGVLLPPCVPLKVSELVLNPMTGTAGDATFKVTDMG
jgi:hypothetical protein